MRNEDKKPEDRSPRALGVSDATCTRLYVQVCLSCPAPPPGMLTRLAWALWPHFGVPAHSQTPSTLLAPRWGKTCLQTPSNPSSMPSELATSQLIFRLFWGTETSLLLCACAAPQHDVPWTVKKSKSRNHQ